MQSSARLIERVITPPHRLSGPQGDPHVRRSHRSRQPGARARGHRHSDSYAEDKIRILNRLKRIEGQVRGIARMVEEDKYCIDVLTQISASTSSLRAVGLLILEDHIRGCVIDGDPRTARRRWKS